ncbi:MAG TPA: M23 family metallopeptidase, partial [Bacteroidota bacterium]|nr:M23 family metallopeptidase [Bacteroidota bacterium]
MKIASLFFLLGALASLPEIPLHRSSTPADAHHTVITGTTPYDSVRAILSGYRWPTEDFLTITSSFADFRSTHFHGGIDISTHRKMGYRVFASKPGFVAHISVSPYGYGKMLIVEHADGYRTVYGHLSRFNDSLETYVEALQHQHDRYPLEANLTPDQFPVNQGDVIAYTGDTGIGVAHLHFEIHDEQFNPVNPLLVPEFAHYIRDSVPPEIRKIAFVPLDPSSRVNDRTAMLVLNAARVSNTKYRFTATVHCTGTVGVELHAMDHSDETWYRSTATDMEMFIDSTFVWSSRITRVLLNETKQIALHFDWGLYKTRRWYFQKLYVEPGNDQPFYGGDPQYRSGIRTDAFAEGTHILRVVVRDVFGNSSEISGSVVFNHPPTVRFVFDTTAISFRVETSSPLRSIVLATIRGTDRMSKSYPASGLTSDNGVYTLPVPMNKKSVVRIQAENIYGSKSTPAFLFGDSAGPNKVSFQFRKEVGRDYIRFTLRTSRALPRLPILEAETSSGTARMGIEQTGLDRYDGIYVPSPSDTGTIRVAARLRKEDDRKQVLDEFSVCPVNPEGGLVVSKDGIFRLRFGAKGVYRYTLFKVDETEDGYQVKPSDELLDRGAIAECLLVRPHTGKVGLFSGRDVIDWTDNGQKEILSGRVREFVGRFSLLEDNDPPEITRVSAYYTHDRVRVSFRIVDHVSGINPDSIRIRIDNEVMIGEFDPYAHAVHSNEVHPLTKGKHIV